VGAKLNRVRCKYDEKCRAGGRARTYLREKEIFFGDRTRWGKIWGEGRNVDEEGWNCERRVTKGSDSN